MKKSLIATLISLTIGVGTLQAQTSKDQLQMDTTNLKTYQLGKWILSREYTEYVTPGFLETGHGTKKRSLDYHLDFSGPTDPHFPIFYAGLAGLCYNPMQIWRPAAAEINEARSWEWGCYPFQDAVAFNSRGTVGMTFALGFGQDIFRMAYPEYFWEDDENTIHYSKVLGLPDYDQTWFSYWTIRLPIELQFQIPTRADDFFIALGPEFEYRLGSRCKGITWEMEEREIITEDLNMHPLGVNALIQIGYGHFTLIGRTSVPELFAKCRKNLYDGDELIAAGTYVWPASIGLGLTF